MFKKKKTYSMDINTAGKMLENVFAACDTKPNEIPFDKIVLRSRQNLFTDNLFIVLSIVLFVVTFLVPLFFPHSPIFMSLDKDSGRPLKVVAHEMTDDSFSITFEGSSLDIESCYMLGADDTTVTAIEYNRFDNTIVFPYVPQEYNIYIFDVNGRFMHLLLAPHK